MDNTSITFDDLYANYLSMISADKRFKNIGSATLIGMYLEMLAATSDMANFNLQRMLEEGFFRTARLDSSHIKLCKNWGYAPRRAIPAQGELLVELKGPFPKELSKIITDNYDNLPDNEKLTITLSNELCNLTFLDMPFRLTDAVKYTFTKNDLENCTKPNWSKRFKSTVIDKTTLDTGALVLSRDPINNANRFPIRCYQGELKTIKFNGGDYIKDLNKKQEAGYTSSITDVNLGQRFDINDLTFSNWYGHRDPFAIKARRKNIDDEYAPEHGLTKVFTRFKNEAESKIFNIEDRSILLNSKILTNFGANPTGDARPCVCMIETNPDKTISINFGPFAYLSQLAIEGKTDKTTGETVYPDLYVTYLSTQGVFGNKNGILESRLTHNNKIMLHTSVGIFDITNNIQFLFAGDLIGGQNFESQMEMDDNAEAYWTSQLKLVSKRDFINYFNSLTTPIDVICALVFGLNSLDNTLEVNQFKKNKDKVDDSNIDINLNLLFYTLASHMYINTGNNIYMPRNIFVKDSKEEWISDGFVPESKNLDNPATIYCDEYNEHIMDFAKYTMSQESYYNKYALLLPFDKKDKNDSQFMKNIKEIASNVKLMTTTNTAIMQLPPFLHYYDLVGNIEVDAGTSNLDDFKQKLQTKIYKYLDTLTLETREIYKSNLIKLCMDEDHVLNADLDVKVSNLIAPIFKDNSWNEEAQIKGVRTILNTEKLTTEYNQYKNLSTLGTDLIFNELIIPRTDTNYNSFKTENLTDENTIHIKFTIYNSTNGQTSEKSSTVDHTSKFTIDNTNPNYIKIYLHTPYIDKKIILPPWYSSHLIFKSTVEDPRGHYDEANAEINDLMVEDLISYGENPNTCKVYNFIAKNSNGGYCTTTSYGNNYWSDSKYEVTSSRATEYGLTLNKLKSLNTDVIAWMEGLKVHNTTDRPIDLPYEIKSFNVVTRSETIIRRGDIVSDTDDTLCEKYFWNYLVKTILNKYYPNITESTDIDGKEWKQAERLIIDLYKLLKPGLSDSILDDNNNIVNYSMDQDIAIVRCVFNVKYQSRI